MKRFFYGLICIALAVSPAVAGTLTLLGVGKPTAAVVGYTGPVDAVGSSALGCYGLEAASTAYANSLGNALDIIRASDSTTQTFKFLSTGKVDVASITSFLTSTTGKVSKIYDQSGNGRDLLQATAASQPSIILNGQGAYPVIRFAGSQNMQTSGTLTQAQAFYVSYLAKRTGATTNFNAVFGTTGQDVQIGFSNSANSVLLFAATVATVSGVADNSFHAVQALMNGASSSAFVDGTLTGSLSVGANAPSPGAVILGSSFSPTDFFNGDFLNMCWFAGDQTAHNAAVNTVEQNFLSSL